LRYGRSEKNPVSWYGEHARARAKSISLIASPKASAGAPAAQGKESDRSIAAADAYSVAFAQGIAERCIFTSLSRLLAPSAKR